MTERNHWILIAAVVWIASGPRFGTARADDVQVNTYTTNNQRDASVAMGADGDFVVVWGSLGSGGTDSSENSIQGQRFAADGSAAGGEFQVNTYTTSYQSAPAVAMDADGDFVAAWLSTGSYGTDSSGGSVQCQRYAADGSPQGGQFQVNTYTVGGQYNIAVAMDADGDFVVAWHSRGSSGTDQSNGSIQGQRYTADGSLAGDEFQVNTYTTSRQFGVSVAVDADGDFVVVWGSLGSFGTDSSGYSIQGQRYAADGSAVGGEFQVNTYTTDRQVRPAVAMDADGNFVVVWNSRGSFGTDSSDHSIQGQRYAADGSPAGGQFQVNTYTTGFQYKASVAMDADGDFVVAWHGASAGTDVSGLSVQGQRYAADGSPVGGEFQVNTFTSSEQSYPSVAAAADGHFVVAWRSEGSFGTDTSGFSVQRTGDPLTVDTPQLVAIPIMSTWSLLLLAGLLALVSCQRLRAARAQT